MKRNYILNSSPTAVFGKSNCGDRGLSGRMKRPMAMTFILMVCLFLAASASHAQINYTQNFATGISSWVITGGDSPGYTTTNVCATTGSLRTNLYSGAASAIFASPNTGTSNGQLATLSYQYKTINFSNGNATGAGACTFLVQYASSASGPWTTVQTIGPSGTAHVPSTSCATKTITFTPAAGNVFIRFSATRASGDYYLYFDEISLTQASTTAPVCATGYAPATGTTGTTSIPTLSWNAAAGASTYKIYFGTSPTPPLATTIATNSYTPSVAFTPNTQYYWSVVPSNTFGDASGCSTQTFTTGPTIGYCAPTYVNGPGTVDIIANVSVGTLNNTSIGNTVSPFYTFYNAVTIPNIGQSSTTTVAVKVGSDTTQFAGAWIDFNQNGNLEPSEGVVSTVTAGANGIANLVFNVPAGAVLGNTRMRVRGGDDVAMNTSQACGATNDPYGETEDYIVNIVTPLPATQCATLNSPANGATNVTDFTLSWTAPASGPVATSYDVYIGTTANPGFFANVTATSIVITGYASNTLYYWKVIPKSATGTDATGCAVRSFTTGNPFLPYCNTITYSSAVEPITLVNFAGINRVSPAAVGGTPALENYIADVANVTSANSYNITLKGNTDGGTFINNFVVFFDWNHDGDLSDANEVYAAGSVTGSTGVDAIQAVTSIAIPEEALAGPTRMRVKKLWSADTGVVTNPCTGGGFGQTEDYTVNVTACTPTIWYADADGDTFGNPAVTQTKCLQPVGYVANNGDCDDNDNTKHDSFPFYVDADGDTYGTGSLVSVCAVNATTPPANYSMNNTDCDDTNNLVYQNGTLFVDADGDGYDAGSQTVCYGAAAPTGFSLTTNGTDCDDTNNGIYQTGTFFVDADNDNYDNGTASVCYGATTPVGYKTTTLGTDCNDNDGSVYQSATLFVDADGDGYDNGSQMVCYGAAVPSGYSATTNGTDCNDADNTVYQSTTLFVDADNDNYDGGSQLVCYGASIPAGFKATTLGTDCNDAVAAINPGATEVGYNGIDEDCDGLTDENGQLITSLLASDCNSTLASIGSLVGITTVAGYPTITGYRIRATNGAQVQVIERGVPNFTMQMFTSFAYATTYTIDIQLQRNGIWMGYYGPTCQISTPAILAQNGAAQVSASQCGIVLPKINTLIATTSIQGVTGYRFRITNLTDVTGPNAVQTVTRGLNWFTLPMLARYNYGTTYQIEVAVKTTGDFGGYGSPCEVSSPMAPSLTNCNATIASGSAPVAATNVAGATQYRFQISRDSDGAAATIDRGNSFFTFNMVPAAVYTPNALYNVRVAVMSAGTWSPFGDVCQITSPAATGKPAAAGVSESMVDFKAIASPNPFASDFGIDVTTTSQENVSVKVYDMLGRLVESVDVKVSDLNTTKVGTQYPAGVYNVIVSQSGIVKTLRVIKR